jgi:HPt (histidine-containing phosphotransfer) domain-containing protein
MQLDEMSEQLGLEPEELLEFSALFVDVASQDLDRLERAIAGSSLQNAMEAAHSIKGAAMGLDLREISAIAAAIEMDARKGSLQDAQDRVSALRLHIRALEQVLRSPGSACSELRSLSGERT